MLRVSAVFSILLCLVAVAFAEVELFSFDVFALVDHAQMEWATGQEGNLAFFTVERSSDGTNYMAVGQVAAHGAYSQYQFSDRSPLDVNFDRTFYYRLKLVDRDATFRYSEVKAVSLKFSAVQQTWGSIKAMFR